MRSAAAMRREKLEALKRHQRRRELLFKTAGHADLHPGDLIDQIQAWWPDCPRWASYLCDRLGDSPTPEFVAQVSAAFSEGKR